jgi:hypothetical protein
MEEGRKVEEERSRYGEQDAWGNSVDAIRANLRLPPIERLRRASQAARSLARLRNARRDRKEEGLGP